MQSHRTLLHVCTMPLMRQRTVQYVTALTQNPSIAMFCLRKGLRLLKRQMRKCKADFF